MPSAHAAVGALEGAGVEPAPRVDEQTVATVLVAGRVVVPPERAQVSALATQGLPGRARQGLDRLQFGAGRDDAAGMRQVEFAPVAAVCAAGLAGFCAAERAAVRECGKRSGGGHLGWAPFVSEPDRASCCAHLVRTRICAGRKSAPGRIRTCGLLLRRQTLYPLSYGGARGTDCAVGRGLA